MTEIMSTAEAAARLDAAPGTLRYWRYMDQGPKSFRVGKHVKYLRADVDEWLDAQRDATSRGGVSSGA